MLLAGLLGGLNVAHAEASVLVKLRGEGDGEVQLVPAAGGQAYSCKTSGGSCRIDGVPGGQYVVKFKPGEGKAPGDRSAMIPPSGTVELFVATGR